jgi:hypothetical protein
MTLSIRPSCPESRVALTISSPGRVVGKIQILLRGRTEALAFSIASVTLGGQMASWP